VCPQNARTCLAPLYFWGRSPQTPPGGASPPGPPSCGRLASFGRLQWVRGIVRLPSVGAWHRSVAFCGCVASFGRLLGCVASFGRLLWWRCVVCRLPWVRLHRSGRRSPSVVALGSSVHYRGRVAWLGSMIPLCGIGTTSSRVASGRDGLVLIGRAPRSGTAASATTSLGSSANPAT
jgi:hypothetical protein